MIGRRRLLAGLFCCLAVAGCGGGGNNGGGSTTSTEPATRLRLLQPGDSWTYTGTATQDTSSIGVELVANIANGNVQGKSVLAQNLITTIDNQSINGATYLVQNADSGDVLTAAGTDGQLYPSPRFALPGTWSASVAQTVTSDDAVYSFVVESKESITVPAGKFNTWRVKQSSSNDFGRSSGTYWYAPETGYFVKANFNTTILQGQYAGQSYSYAIQLRSTNTLSR